MTLTHRVTSVTQAIIDLLKANWHDLGLNSEDDIFYGLQPRYPRFPSISVDPNNRNRDLNELGSRTVNTFNVFLLIHHGPLQNVSVTQKQADEFAEGIEELLHANRSLGGLLIHSYVTNSESGAIETGGALVRTTRLTWQGISKTGLI